MIKFYVETALDERRSTFVWLSIGFKFWCLLVYWGDVLNLNFLYLLLWSYASLIVSLETPILLAVHHFIFFPAVLLTSLNFLFTEFLLGVGRILLSNNPLNYIGLSGLWNGCGVCDRGSDNYVGSPYLFNVFLMSSWNIFLMFF